MLYIRDMGMATYNLLNFKMRPVNKEGMRYMYARARKKERSRRSPAKSG